ncbi:MAG: ftsK [Bacillota bacterium]|nr:ftsK [Bacillota bacterium]
MEENIKIYDYSNNDKTRSDITQLKIDDSQTQINNKSNNETSFNAENNDFNLKEVSEVKEVVEIKEEKKVKQKESKLEPFEKKEISDDIINTLSSTIQGKYKLPSSSLLENTPSNVKGERGEKEELRKDGEKLIETLNNFNIPCNILQINKGPTITRYEIQPAPGIKVSKITSLSNDLAMALATSQIRMEAPIPGKAAIGIEVANKIKSSVHLRSIVESKEYKSANTNIPFALGKDIAGKNIVASIDKMPHLLIAGATGSGKSVCINTLIMSILFRAKPDEVKLILIDPKVVELSIYNSVPHLLIPVVTDPRKAANALNWAVSEMTNRYKIFAANSVRDIFSYNERMVKENKEKMPQIVIIIDELADLMTVASSEVEEYITRIAQLARACGMHLVIATQRPSVDVITGVIKANIPSRIAFAVSSYIDSRTILDTAGAEKLLGKGDMLYHPMGMSKPIRIQGTFISDEEIKAVVDYIREQQIELKTPKCNDIMKEIEKNPEQPEDVDEFLEQAVEMVVNDGQASASYIQRKFKVGYSRAARIIDQLEDRGIVGGHEGSKPRKVLITKEELEEMRGNN